jgi:hypothetical protein
VRQEPLSTWSEELHKLDLGAFPEVDEFIVEIKDLESETTLRYLVPSWEISVGFPWWNCRASEMRGWTLADIPSGSLRKPYCDYDLGYSLLIWEAGDRVYIMNGADSEEIGEPEIFEVWFKVPIELYRSAWKVALESL